MIKNWFKFLPRTKIVGYLIIAVAILNTVVDIMDGGGFNFSAHMDDIYSALGGAGFIYLRTAVDKVKNNIKTKI